MKVRVRLDWGEGGAEHQRSPGSPERPRRVPTAGEPAPVQRRFVQFTNNTPCQPFHSARLSPQP